MAYSPNPINRNHFAISATWSVHHRGLHEWGLAFRVSEELTCNPHHRGCVREYTTTVDDINPA